MVCFASALFYSMFSITSAVLQGLDQQKWVVYSLLIGLVVKVISNYPLILIFDGEGTAISTYVGFGATIIIQMALIQKVGKYKWSENYVALKNVIKQTLVMAIALIPLGATSYFFTSYISQAIILFVGLIVAGIIYCVLAYKNKTLFEVVSKNKIDGLLKKLKSA
ncbi:hypothetical protein F6Y05_36675 [Bacillus megaterium]|nr:hypothetical protein [Priestia megaterium]